MAGFLRRKTGLYTTGNEYTLNDVSYTGDYNIDSTGRAWTRKVKVNIRGFFGLFGFASKRLLPIAVTIETGDDNIDVTTSDTIDDTSDINNQTIDDTIIKVGNFTLDGFITIYGEYPQNSVDIRKFDLSNLNVVSNDIAQFNFILTIREDVNSIPQMYVTSDVFNELIIYYDSDNPLPVNSLIHNRKVIVVELAQYKVLTEEMRTSELSINLNKNEANGQVEVIKNLFTYSNYTVDTDGNLIANPTYDLNELIKYINWVVSKPSGDYDERLIPALILGEWVRSTTETDEDEPSAEVTNTIGTTYPPVGRKGTIDLEEQIVDGKVWAWIEDQQFWVET